MALFPLCSDEGQKTVPAYRTDNDDDDDAAAVTMPFTPTNAYNIILYTLLWPFVPESVRNPLYTPPSLSGTLKSHIDLPLPDRRSDTHAHKMLHLRSSGLPTRVYDWRPRQTPTRIRWRVAHRYLYILCIISYVWTAIYSLIYYTPICVFFSTSYSLEQLVTHYTAGGYYARLCSIY